MIFLHQNQIIMSYVTQYSKVGTNTLYDAKVCTDDKCHIITDQYKLTNKYPSDQMFPFPSTKDNLVVMVPDRIMHDDKAFDSYVIAHATKQKCFSIDPCDVYSSRHCCSPTSSSSSSSTTEEAPQNTSNTSWLMLSLFFLFVLIFLIVLALLGYAFFRSTKVDPQKW